MSMKRYTNIVKFMALDSGIQTQVLDNYCNLLKMYLIF